MSQTFHSNISINDTSLVAGLRSNTASLNFGEIGAGNTAEQTLSVTGAEAGQPVFIGTPAALEAGLTPAARVSAANTVTVRLRNHTEAAITPTAANYTAVVLELG